MGQADGLNDAAELKRGSCPEQSDIDVERRLMELLVGDDKS